MKYLMSLVLLLMVWSPVGLAQQQGEVEDFSKQSIAEIKKGISAKHPFSYMVLASKLYKEQKFDAAARWYYIGQIRYRAYLTANPQLDPSGDPALYSSVKQVVGLPINQQIASNTDNWAAVVSQALKWHKNNPNGFTPKSQHPEIYLEIETGLKEFHKYILDNKEEIRKQRAANGLENN